MDEFNALKKYVECIPLTEKLIELAKLRNDEDGEIASLWKLVRFYVFMEDFEMESMIYGQLLEIFEERGNLARANDYLEETYQGAVEFQMHDHIIDNLKMRIEFSEGAQNYADALKYTRALYAHQAKVDSVSADFDEQRYYTRLENERLEAEKASQALELQLKNNQLVSLAVIGALALLLAAGLFFGFRKQQQRRRELHQQNTLIQEQAEQLKNLDQAKTRFFANVSHELRTPLTLMLVAQVISF